MLFLFVSFWFVLLLGGCWIWSLATFGLAKWNEWPEEMRLRGRRLKWLSTLMLVTAVFLWLVLFPSPISIYRTEFGEKPTADVQILKGVSDFGSDSQQTLLCFQAAPSTIQRLAKIKKLHKVPVDKRHFDNLTGSNVPEWWKPNLRPDAQLYELEKRNQADSYSAEDFSLFFDPQTQTAYYSFFGVD